MGKIALLRDVAESVPDGRYVSAAEDVCFMSGIYAFSISSMSQDGAGVRFSLWKTGLPTAGVPCNFGRGRMAILGGTSYLVHLTENEAEDDGLPRRIQTVKMQLGESLERARRLRTTAIFRNKIQKGSLGVREVWGSGGSLVYCRDDYSVRDSHGYDPVTLKDIWGNVRFFLAPENVYPTFRCVPVYSGSPAFTRTGSLGTVGVHGTDPLGNITLSLGGIRLPTNNQWSLPRYSGILPGEQLWWVESVVPFRIYLKAVWSGASWVDQGPAYTYDNSPDLVLYSEAGMAFWFDLPNLKNMMASHAFDKRDTFFQTGVQCKNVNDLHSVVIEVEA
jgi:hypothetical protein